MSDVIERFRFDDTIGTLQRMGLLCEVVGKFAQADLHPDTVTNIEMGYLYKARWFWWSTATSRVNPCCDY